MEEIQELTSIEAINIDKKYLLENLEEGKYEINKWRDIEGSSMEETIFLETNKHVVYSLQEKT
jgi:hypothetical protein